MCPVVIQDFNVFLKQTSCDYIILNESDIKDFINWENNQFYVNITSISAHRSSLIHKVNRSLLFQWSFCMQHILLFQSMHLVSGSETDSTFSLLFSFQRWVLLNRRVTLLLTGISNKIWGNKYQSQKVHLFVNQPLGLKRDSHN